MDFSLTEEQQMLKKSARDFLATECPKSVIRQIEASETGHSPEIWKKMADLGWMGLALPEEYGGSGMKLLDLAVLVEEFGRAAMPGPFINAVIFGGRPIAEFGTEDQKKALLPGVASGEIILTSAVWEPEAESDPRFISTRAIKQAGKFVLTGTKLFVPYASVANHILIAARTSGKPGDEKGLTVFIVDAKSPGLTLTPFKTLAGDKQFEVALDNVAVSASDVLGTASDGLAIIRSTLLWAAAIQCAEMIGGAQQELEMTTEYAKTRVQFERPIGSFQAVQHHMADMFIDMSGARWTTYQAIWKVSEGLPAEKDVAVAKVFANMACQRIAFGAQGIHAGVGVDMDHDLQFYFRRQKAFDLKNGTTSQHLKTIEAQL
ncbi:MAG: acyl-CoA dehydrogenase [Chloroflexi bacterium]|nr:acyl-CoA dehydrogenase [Chloroflexota bacterium]